MKLTKHQKEIVKKIYEEKVYDIPSYLKVFNKFEIAKYDMVELEKRFKLAEKGKKYKIITNPYVFNSALANNIPIKHLLFVPIQHIKKDTLSLYENNSKEEDAIFDNKSIKKTAKHNEIEFTYDFVNDGVFVQKSFSDIKDFITLWSYLKREALIIEVNKTITQDDISVFFEKKQKNNSKNISIFANPLIPIEDNGYYFKKVKKTYNNYLDYDWYINEEHKLICEEYIEKKILPNSDLKIYINNKFRTASEVGQSYSLFVAWLAIIIAVVTPFLDKILPWSNNNDNDDLKKKVNTIESHLEQINTNLKQNEKSDNTSEILDEIKAIREQLNKQK